MLPDPGTALWLVLLGGWMAVDGTSCGQFMVSRPFVAAALAGWIVGDPAAGLVAGVILELFHLAVLPVGAARYPEGGPAGVVAGALYATSGDTVPGALLMTVAFALVWEWVGGESLRVMRQVNVRLIAGPEEHSSSGQLQRRHFAAIGLDFVRGMVVVGVGLVFLSALLIISARHWALDPEVSRLALWASTVGLLAATLGVFGMRARIFLLGMAGGLIFILLQG